MQTEGVRVVLGILVIAAACACGRAQAQDAQGELRVPEIFRAAPEGERERSARSDLRIPDIFREESDPPPATSELRTPEGWRGELERSARRAHAELRIPEIFRSEVREGGGLARRLDDPSPPGRGDLRVPEVFRDGPHVGRALDAP